MAKKTFWWGNFDIKFIKAIIYGENTPKSQKPSFNYNDIDFLMPYMEEICRYPDEYFVRRYRREIEDYFLCDSNHLVNIMHRLETLNYGGCSVSTNDEMMFQLRKKRMTQTVLDCYVQELRSSGKKLDDTTDSIFAYPRTLDLTSAVYNNVPLYSFQEEAVEKLENYYFDEEHKSGVLVMPTGSGKTRTSVYFLLKGMVSRGYQVIWLAHRWMLLEQAAEQFYRFAPLITMENPDMENFKMVCVSGKHSRISALEKDDNLILSSVQSLCNRTMYLPNILQEKVVIVIDEAHHSIAPSYRRIINAIRNVRPDAKLLGLTATPFRMKNCDTKALMHMYEDKPVYSVTMPELIAQNKLAKPIPISIETKTDITPLINIDEEKYIRKWGEMPDSLVKKVASTNERNEIIVNEYVKNVEKYGKTIVFALNAIHCDTLNEMFREKGIRSDYVYNLKNKEENDSIIERFRYNERKDGIDVLININILTEGSDLPDIQTVFLTRPTSSDVLLLQMVGRGMRGVESGGTETVNVVDFCDKWPSFVKWMKPEYILGEQINIDEEEKYKYKPVELIPMEMIRDIAKGITYKGAGVTGKYVSLPVGWYDVNDEEGNDTKILVYEDQFSGYEALKKDMNIFINNTKLEVSDVFKGYFRTMGMPPLKKDIEEMLLYMRTSEEFPEFYTFDQRDKIDPCKISEEIKKKDMRVSEISQYIKKMFDENKELIVSIYDSYNKYSQRVMEFLTYENGRVPVGTIVEEVEKKYYHLSSEPIKRDLEELLTEVIDLMSDELSDDFIRPEIYWTDSDYKSYFAKYVFETNQIFVNNVLNSVSIEEEVIKYLIYHECLHQEFEGHGPAFRDKEHKYPDFQRLDTFLDYKFREYIKD